MAININFFRKLRGISCLGQELLTSEEGLYCKELNSVEFSSDQFNMLTAWHNSDY